MLPFLNYQMKKEKFHIEFVMGTATQSSLWRMLSTADGLSEWFADDVEIDEKNNQYTFIWNKTPSLANSLHCRPQSSLRLQWEDDADKNVYFEFSLHKLELSGGIGFEVTDFAEPDEKMDAISLWESQVYELKRKLGV